MRNIRSSQTWPEPDLIRRLCHALDIAYLAVKHLAPSGYRNLNAKEEKLPSQKPIGETAMLLHGASLVNRPEIDARVHKVARRLAEYARSPQMKMGMTLNPALAFEYALAHIVLTRLGYPDDSFDKLLTECLSAQAHASLERFPHRVMEQQWIASLWSKDSKGSRRNRLAAARLSILGRPMDVLMATDDNLYAFTHAVMYVTGYEFDAGSLPRPRPVILAEVEAALAGCLDRQDYDLAGELLLAWPLTGRSWSTGAAFAFRVLAEVEDKVGFLPTPATRVKEMALRQGDERKRYLLATTYHAAYVMGLLCAAALRPGCAPGLVSSARGEAEGSAQQLLPWLRGNGMVPHWLETFGALTSRERDALAGMMFTVALQRRAAKKDFAGIEHLLRVGCSLGLADSPVASQAAELLGRVSVFAGGLGSSAPAEKVAC